MDDFWTLGGAPRGGERPVTSVGAWLLSRFDRLPVRARRDDPFLTPTDGDALAEAGRSGAASIRHGPVG
jgi:hypothetical protein